MNRLLALTIAAAAVLTVGCSETTVIVPADTTAAQAASVALEERGPCVGLDVDVVVRPLAVLVHFVDTDGERLDKHEGTVTGSHRLLDCLAARLGAPAVRAQLANVEADPGVTVTEHGDVDVIAGLSPLQPSDRSFGWPPAQAKAILDLYDAHTH